MELKIHKSTGRIVTHPFPPESIYEVSEQLSVSLLDFENLLHLFLRLLCSRVGFDKSIY